MCLRAPGTLQRKEDLSSRRGGDGQPRPPTRSFLVAQLSSAGSPSRGRRGRSNGGACPADRRGTGAGQAQPAGTSLGRGPETRRLELGRGNGAGPVMGGRGVTSPTLGPPR